MKNKQKNITLSIAAVVLIIYISLVSIFEGIQKSISATWFVLPENIKWIFRVIIWLMSAVIVCVGNELLFYMSGALLSLVGFFPETTVLWKRIIHLIGAIGGIGLSIIKIDNWYVIGAMIISIPITYICTKKYWILITELIAIVVILGGFYLTK